MKKRPRGRPPYPEEFRQRMVELVRAGRSPTALAREFNVTAQSITNWVGRASLPGKGGVITSEHQELLRLREQLLQVQAERDILANAVHK